MINYFSDSFFLLCCACTVSPSLSIDRCRRLTPWLPAQATTLAGSAGEDCCPSDPNAVQLDLNTQPLQGLIRTDSIVLHIPPESHTSKASTGSLPFATTHHLHSSDPVSCSSPTSQNSCLCHLELMDYQGKLLLWMSSPPAWPNLNLVLPMDTSSPALSPVEAARYQCCLVLLLLIVIISSNSYSANTTGPGAWSECPPGMPLQFLDHSSSFFL